MSDSLRADSARVRDSIVDETERLLASEGRSRQAVPTIPYLGTDGPRPAGTRWVFTRDSLDWKPIFLILGGLASLILLIAFGGGFMIGTAILFATTSAAFGRRAFLSDLLIGAVIAVLIYLLFGKLLTLSLPAGPLENLF